MTTLSIRALPPFPVDLNEVVDTRRHLIPFVAPIAAEIKSPFVTVRTQKDGAKELSAGSILGHAERSRSGDGS